MLFRIIVYSYKLLLEEKENLKEGSLIAQKDAVEYLFNPLESYFLFMFKILCISRLHHLENQ